MFTPNIPRRGHPPQNPIVITSDTEDEATDDSMELDHAHAQTQTQTRQQMGFLEGYNHPQRPRHPQQQQQHQQHPRHAHPYTTTLEQEKKVRSRLREERHAALCVLMDRELLTIQALAAQETLPQARRRFLAKLMAPDDPDMAASIRADRFTIQHPSTSSSSSSTSTTVQRKIVDVHESDDTGWRRPTTTDPSAAVAAAVAVAGVSSPGGSSATPPASRGHARRVASMTPERTRHSPAGRPRASASRSQQTRERERRRRWSGAEREDAGVAFGGFSP